MPATVPFLARFATRLSKEEVESSSNKAASEKDTLVTKVDRETTDDR